MSSERPSPIQLTQPVASSLLKFDKYLLVRKLAEGGMAELFLAKQVGAEGFERDVVIKCMLGQFSRSTEFVNMFLDEARLAAKLFHPNIVQIIDLNQADGRYFICMEYLAGEDLEAIIERNQALGQQIPVALAVKIILAACEGLEFAHNHREGGKCVNLVHRDVSPSNIIVTFVGTVKVVDFGIAKASSKAAHTQPGMLKGKLGYMSPEQARGHVLDARSDIFSLGVTFFELITGRRVFEKENEMGVLMALLEQQVRKPSEIRTDLPPALDHIILKAMARNLEDRYRTTAELRVDLETFLSTVPVPSSSQVGQYVQDLFDSNRVRNKMQIPTLKELEAHGVFGPEAPTAATTDPTFIRAASKPVERNSGTQIIAPESKPSRWAGILLGVILTVTLLAGGGAAVIFWPRAKPVAIAPIPVSVLPPATAPAPEAQPALEPLTAPEPAPESIVPPSPIKPVERKRTARALAINRQDVAKVLQRHGEKIIACGESHRDQLPADGVVKVLFTVQNSGSVKEAKVTTESTASTDLGRCLVRKLSALHFPKNGNDPELVIEQPLRFQKQ